MDCTRLGCRVARLGVERSLEEDQGRDERRDLLGDLRRRGLRGMEIGREERWLGGGCSTGGGRWLRFCGKIGAGGCGAGGWLAVRS